MLNKEEEENIVFLLQMLSATVGGEPSLGLGGSPEKPDGKFIVISACKCANCEEFRKRYLIELSDGMVTAARTYARARISFAQEMEQETGDYTCH